MQQENARAPIGDRLTSGRFSLGCQPGTRGAKMLAEAMLREKARAAMLNGKLPRATPNRTFLAGAGTVVACAVCAELVTTDQAEIELQFTGEGVQPRLNRYHLHVWCFTAWKVERGCI
jgi:hypothetical protein